MSTLIVSHAEMNDGLKTQKKIFVLFFYLRGTVYKV